VLIETISVIIDVTLNRLWPSGAMVLKELRLDCEARCEWTTIYSIAHVTEADICGVFQLSQTNFV
jgi:hypothetical protein